MLFLMSKNVCRMRLQVVFFTCCCCCNFCFCFCCCCCCLLLAGPLVLVKWHLHLAKRKSTVAAGNRSSEAAKGATEATTLYLNASSNKSAAYFAALSICSTWEGVCVWVFVCIDVIPSSDIQIILSSGRSHKATTNSKCKKYFKSEQHMCNTLHATLLTIDRAGRECVREREREHTCVLPRICILIML